MIILPVMVMRMALSGGSAVGRDDGGTPDARTILVVEDDPNTRRVLVLLLEIHGYQVIQSANGESGLGVARDVGPDLVVSDLQLPGMSGIDLAANVRQAQATVPVIAITSGPDALVEKARRSRHFSGVLRKPIDVNRLLELVDELMTQDGG